MRKIISNIISFITSILLISLLVLVSIYFENNNFNYNLNRINYYDKAYESIKEEINLSIINTEIRNDYLDFITIDLVKNDIDNSINGKGYNNYKDFESIIKKYSKDQTIIDKYTSNVNEIYESNLFPNEIFSKLNSFIISKEKVLMISIITLVVVVLFEIVLYLINKNINYIYNNLLSFSVFGLLLGIVLIYINRLCTDYIMELLLMTLKYSFSLCFYFCICIFIVLTIIYFIFIKKCYRI